MGSRLGAWVIDSVIFVGFQMAFWMVAGALGAIQVNPEAERQMQASPLVLPTVTPYQTNMPLLASLLMVFVLLSVAYAAFCWARFRGMPGQRLMSLQVGDAATGRNLSLRRSVARAVLAVGVPIAAGAGLLFGVMAFETSVPWSDVVSTKVGGPADAWLASWSGGFLLALMFAVGWPVLLLVSTFASSNGQGLHDRSARSLVVGKARSAWSGAAGLPGFGPGYGLPPGVSAGQYMPPGGASGSEPGEPVGGDPAALPNGDPVLGGPAWTAPPADADAPATFHAATVGRRIGGYLIDCTLVYMGFSLIAAAVTASDLPSKATTIDERTFILIGLAGGLMQLVYFTASWAVWHGTLGQRVMHMRLDDATTGKALSWMDALVRWAVLQGPFALVMIVPAIARTPVLMAASFWAAYLIYTTTTDPDVRGLHDRFLNSRVGLEP